MKTLFSDTALVMIDVQEGFNDASWGRRNNPLFEVNIGKLLSHGRMRGLPIIHVQHLSTQERSPLRPDRPGSDFMSIARPLGTESIIIKNVNSAFIGTALEKNLRDRGVKQVILSGLTTDHCVSTTARMAANLGFSVIIPADATATFDRVGFDETRFPAEVIYQTALASLHGEFATVLPLKELLDSKVDP